MTRCPYFWIGNTPPGGDLGPDQPMVVMSLWPILHEQPDIDAISDHFSKDIVAKQPDGPYLVGGFCYGALVAYEVARKLVATGHAVQLLTLVHPSRLGPAPMSRRRRLVQRVLLSLRHPSTAISYLAQQFPGAGPGNEPEAPQQRLSLLLNEYLSGFDDLATRSARSYVPRPYDGRVTVIVGDRILNGIFCRRVFAPLIREGIDLHRVPAAHWKELHSSRALAARIRACIDDAIAEGITPSAGRGRARR